MSAITKFIYTRVPKYRYMLHGAGERPFTLLDIGAGNGSPSETMNTFPNCTYHGLDLNYDYGYAESDKKAIVKFFEMDLTELKFDEIQDDHYDHINMTHIIEHLYNGDVVIEKLSEKLKKGGFIYIEYPGQKSTTLPSRPGTLNFYDDKTHVRIFSVPELTALMEKIGFEVISSGTRRSWFHIMAMPFRVLFAKLRGKPALGGVFWDYYGFAEYMFARKKL